MDDAQLFERMLASLHAFAPLVVAGAADSHLVERDGVSAGVVPRAPDRSVFNSVFYTSATALAQALEELAAIYESEAVRAWTVWVPARDREAAAVLERAGHRLDAEPAAMVLELARLERPGPLKLELDDDPKIVDIARLNDIAYGYESDFVRALAGLPKGAAHRYVAVVDGAPAACLITTDHDGDCWIGCVATLPEMRGRGLATSLLAHALAEARERGCLTASLQATRLGKPVYERIGHRDLGSIQMWERR